MADRVAIIGGCGQDQDGIAGTGGSAGSQVSGRDHFPFLVISTGSSVGDGTNFPFSVTLTQAAKWFYLVRRWQCSFEIDAVFGVSSTDASYSGSFDFGFNVASVDPDTSEQLYYAYAPDQRESDVILLSTNELVFGSGNDQAGFDAEPHDVTDFFFPFNVKNFTVTNAGPSKTFQLFVGFSELRWVGGAIYPLIILRIETTTFSIYTNVSIGSRFVAGYLDLDGATVELRALNFNPVGTGGSAFVNSANVTITPIEYWPYATKAGLPVYDTSTGAQLRDPFS